MMMKSKHMDPTEPIRDSIESIREVVAHNGQQRIAVQEKDQRNSRGCQKASNVGTSQLEYKLKVEAVSLYFKSSNIGKLFPTSGMVIFPHASSALTL
jgi:hypothetical protein